MRAEHRTTGYWLLATALAGLLLAACEQPVDLVASRRPSARVRPLCYEGCDDVDSFPDSVGVFIDYETTPDACTGDDIDDVDGDGLADFCEERIADAFMPVLEYSSYDADYELISSDNVLDGEPAYAIKPVYVSGRLVVRIMYMFSYYVDGGTGYCGDFDLPESLTCGHWGDSEAIVLDVRYEPTFHHWVLDKAAYSQHGHYELYWIDQASVPNTNGASMMPDELSPVDGYPTALSYDASHHGGIPVVHVSLNKHANYASESECNAGIFGGGHIDEVCEGNRNIQISILPARNVGSSSYPLMDCVASTNPSLEDNGYEECYWTGERFGGWTGAEPNSSPYSDRLDAWAF